MAGKVAKARSIVQGMGPWFSGINERKARRDDDRTLNEECFDSGVFAAAEMIRRLTGDEELSLAIHEVCICKQRQHENGKGA